MPKINDGAYIINIDKYSDIGTRWVALYMQNNNNNVIYFNSFGVEHIPKEIKTFINRPSSFILRFAMLRKIKTLKQIFSEYKHTIQ